MRILLITQYFWPENFQINFLIQHLVKNKHEVTVLTGLPNYPQGKIYPGYRRFWPIRESWQGAEIIRVPLIPRGNKSNFKLMLNYISFVLSGSIFAPFLCRKRYDVLFVYEPSPITQVLPAILLRSLKKLPLLLWVQDLWPQSLTATKRVKSAAILRWVNKLVHFIYQRCDAILMQSQAFSSHLEGFGVEKSRMYYLPNSAEDFYRPLSLLPHFVNSYKLPQGFKVLFAGNIGHAQAIPTILAAAEQLRGQPVQWVFAGDGSSREFLEKEIIARKLEQTTHWIGSFPAHEMPYLFASCDALLLSLNKNEIFSLTIPSKLQSYLACGKPIVAAIDGEANRIIQEAHCGLAVAAEDHEQLANAVLSIYNLTASEREEMGMRGFEYCQEHFASQKLIAQLEGLFESLSNHKLYKKTSGIKTI